MKWMVGKRSQISRLIRGRAFLLATSRGCPVELPSRHVTSLQFTCRRDETHKAEQPQVWQRGENERFQFI